MSRLRAACAVLALLGASVAAAESDGVPPWVGRFLGLGRTASVEQWVDEQVAHQGHHPILDTVRGAAAARDADFVRAVELFDAGLQGEWYTRVGLRYHADALREAGYPDQAARLRLAHMRTSPMTMAQAYTLHMLVVHDLRFEGAMDAALDEAEQLVALYPQSASAWSTLAEVLLDLGRIDEAHVALNIGAEQGRKGQRQVSPTRLRAYLEAGDLWGAEQHMAAMGKRLGARKAYWVAWLHLQLELGNPAIVLIQLDRKRFARDQTPSYAALRARAQLQLGQTDAAVETLSAVLQDYPTHPDVVYAAEILESAGLTLAP